MSPPGKRLHRPASLARETCAAKSERTADSQAECSFQFTRLSIPAEESSGLAGISQMRDKSVLRCQVAASIALRCKDVLSSTG